MQLHGIKKYYVLLFCTMFVSHFENKCRAQNQIVKGNVYAFKNLELNKIHVRSKKSGNVVFTSADGSFKIKCRPNDKLVFKGKGFERTTEKISAVDSISVKMIFKGSQANRTEALCNSHVKKDEIDFAIIHYSAYNYYPIPNHTHHPFSQMNSKYSESHMPFYGDNQPSQNKYKLTSNNIYQLLN